MSRLSRALFLMGSLVIASDALMAGDDVPAWFTPPPALPAPTPSEPAPTPPAAPPRATPSLLDPGVPDLLSDPGFSPPPIPLPAPQGERSSPPPAAAPPLPQSTPVAMPGRSPPPSVRALPTPLAMPTPLTPQSAAAMPPVPTGGDFPAPTPPPPPAPGPVPSVDGPAAGKTLPDRVGANGPGELPPVLVELDGSGSYDPDGDPVEFRWRQIEGPRVQLSDSKSAKPFFKTDRVGVYVFELVVSNGAMTSDPALVEVRIEPENRAPAAKVAAAEMLVETGAKVRIDASPSSDPDNDPLTFAWKQTDGQPLIEELAPPVALDRAVLEFTAPRHTGVFEFTVTVSDGDKTDDAVVRLTVRPPRKPPVVVIKTPTHMLADPQPVPAAPPEPMPLPDMPLPIAEVEGPRYVKPEEPVFLDGRGSHSPRGVDARLAFNWTQKAGPFVRAVSKNEPPGTLRFVPRESGEYHWELVVDDGNGAAGRESNPARFIVTVTPTGEPPVAVVKAQEPSVLVGQVATLSGAESRDPAGGALRYEWRQAGGPPTRFISPQDHPELLRFQPGNPGEYVFELVVAVGDIRSEPARVTVPVTAPNRPPIAAIQAPERAAPGQTVTLRGSAKDPDGDTLQWQWRQIQGPRLLAKPVQRDTIEITPAEPGIYVFSFDVTDGINPFVARRAVLRVEEPGATAAPAPSQPSARPAATVRPAP